MYEVIKHLHMLFALLSISGFIVRAMLAFKDHPWLNTRFLKVMPHVNDTFLLLAALYLAWSIQATPFNSPWLLAKIIALLLYIIFATRVIKLKGGTASRVAYFMLSLLSFAYIVAVAMTKQVLAGL